MLSVARFLSTLNRREKVVIQVAVDSVLIVLCFFVSMLIRFESFRFLNSDLIWGPIAIAFPVTLVTFHFSGLYRLMVRFVSGRIFIAVGQGALISGLTLFLSNSILNAGIPRSVPVIHTLFLLLMVGGLRILVRNAFRRPNQMLKQSVLIYGAGEAGLQLLSSLFHGGGYVPVAFVDDNPSLQGLKIGGLQIHKPNTLPKLIRDLKVKAVLLAIPSAPRTRRREIVATLEDLGLEIKTTPSMTDIVEGSFKVSELRNITPEDLLGRDPIAPNKRLLRKNIAGKVVMVSGAGGSIGSELCKQILSQEPTSIVLYDVSEYSLYSIETELSIRAQKANSATKIFPILGSIQNSGLLEITIRTFQVQTIFHAAAYKHVPLVEENVVEGIQNNVFGSLILAKLSLKLSVENFTLVSTDKAVRPTNIMGATKRVTELICQSLSKEKSNTVFSMVRFGNVLGSSGSVIPRFREQIESGGPVTVTHRDINRYFMTIPEASQLVIQAGAMANGGDVFILDMGMPVKIVDLAQSLIKLHGFRPYFATNPEDALPHEGDIPICFTGLRKGEKLHEELLIGSNPKTTEHPRIMAATEVSLQMAQLMPILDRLKDACTKFDLPEIQAIFQELPLGYSPQRKEVSDLLWNAERFLAEKELTKTKMNPR